MHRSVCLLVCVGLVGCASDDPGDCNCGVRATLISFVSNPAQPAYKGYSAFDGNAHDYRVVPHLPSATDEPTAANPDPVLPSSLVWTVDDAFLNQEAYDGLDSAILVTTKRAGTTTIAVSGKTMSGAVIRSAATLEISQANSDEWRMGDERYSTGVPNDIPGWKSTHSTADRSACGLPGTTIDELTKTTACANCHDNSSGISFAPTPDQIAGYSDDDLIQIFTTGWKPAGFDFTSNILKNVPDPDCVYQAFHSWDIDDASKKGLVWKMRSLRPMEVDPPDSDM